MLKFYLGTYLVIIIKTCYSKFDVLATQRFFSSDGHFRLNNFG